jgi:hypothetical protein
MDMTDFDRRLLSRRRWIGVASPSILAASLGAGMPAGKGYAAESSHPAAEASGNDLGARVYNVRDYGAKGDGISLDTVAVQAAVDACTRDRKSVG